MKKELRPLTKLWLFLSSYVPLWILLLIPNFDGFSGPNTRFLCILTFFSFASLYLFIRWAKEEVRVASKEGEKKICDRILFVVEYEDMSSSYLEYLLTYVLSLLAFIPERTTMRSILMLLFLMTIIFLLYDKAGLIYANPILGLFGYKIFKVKDKKLRRWIVLITKNEILPISESNRDIGICASHLWGNVYLEV
ncbi:hypothetical protein [Thermococcus sp. GR6]|uniref:hypothetical protein n=1 Tax=Thermococcus sp. GR6 TaxID=1638256 RepID=UPI0014320D35|nr:hypothetical protein [Thermococcus sp. GR6]NJE41834.1 hypothetical protein [Thermococcus sp. GR6]